MRVAVVGGGAVGVTAARDLAAGGADVVLFERGAVGDGATGRAAGICYDAFADRVDAEIADRALERFRALDGEAGFRFEPTPYVWFATEEGSTAEAIREGVEAMQARGRAVELADPTELQARFPGVRFDDVAVAAVARDAARTDPAAYAAAMASKAHEAGVEIREGATVGVRADPPRVSVGAGERIFDAVLVAAGAHTPGLLADAGIPVPVKPYRVQALVGAAPGAGAGGSGDAVPMLYDATEGYYLRPHPEGLLAGDGTEPVEADPDDWNRDGDDWFVAAMERRLADRLVEDGAAVGRAWAGLCTATPDGDPLLGELRDGLYVATGWQGHGFMRAPATAERVAGEILGDDGVAAFDPRRFDGDEEFEIVEGMAVE